MSEINEDLTSSDKQFENVFKLIPNPIYLFERVENDLILIKYNDAAKLFSIGKIDEYLGFKMSDLYPEHLDFIEELKNDVVIKGHLSRELKFKLKSTGIEKTVNTTWYKIRPDLIMVILYDITEQRQVEDALRKSEREKSLIFENIPELIVFQDINHNIIWCNKAACESVDLSLEQIIGRKCFEIWQNRNLVCENCSVDIALKTGRQEKAEAITPDGRIWYIKGYPVRDDKGNIIGAVELTTDITEPKKVGKKLKESEEKFSKVFHSSPNLMTITRLRDNLFVDVNDAFINYLGYSREELINHTSTELNLWVNLEQRHKILKEIKENIRVKNLEIQVNSKKGDQLTMLFSADMINLNNEEFMITMASDITERKEAEQELKEKNIELSIFNRIITLGNESRSLQEFLEKSYDQVLEMVGFNQGGIYLYDPETQHNILVLHKNVNSNFISTVENVDISKGLFSRVFNKDEPFIIEDFSKYLEASKELGVYSVAIIPLRSKDEYVGSMNVGSPVHQILSQNELDLLVAIGKQMGIIIQKFQSEKLLKESEKKYRSLFENMTEGFAFHEVITDENNTPINYKYIEANPAFEKLTGVNVSKILGKTVTEILPGTENDPADWIGKFGKVGLTGEPISIEAYSEVIEKWYRVSGYSPKKRYFAVTFSDITERKLAEQKLKESEEKYRDAFNRSELYKDIFTHDINNILQNILTSTELSNLYLNDPDQSEKFKEISNLMNEQIIRGKKLVSNVQKLFEVEEFETAIDSVESFNILSKAIKFVKESFSYKVLNINVNSFQSQYFVNSNGLLINIFENILFNAVKHNTSQTIEILVRISKDNKNGKNFIKFEFLDNGIGIPNQMKSEIFSRKYQEYRKDKVPSGIGLGLLLVNRILDSYGGEIRVEDRIEGDYSKGSNFIILIPEAV